MLQKLKRFQLKIISLKDCAEGPKFSSFWPTMRTSLSNIRNIHNKDIILEDNNKIINDQTEVATTFNNLFIQVAKNIGSNENIKK